MKLRTLSDCPDIAGKRVIIRVDFNVPLDEHGGIRNDKRMRFALPTLRYLLEKGANQLVLMTHVGRPKNAEPHLKTDEIARHLAVLLGKPVVKEDGWGEKGLPEAPIVLLENLRFNPGEKSKNEAERDAFGKQLAALADIYVNEAFSNSHRFHASMTSVPKFLPAYAGFGLAQEVEHISAALEAPKRPLVAVIGGLKADKLPAIRHLAGVADRVLVAGALAFALLKWKGYKVGTSKIDEEGMTEMADLTKEVLVSPKVVLPMDAVVADSFAPDAKHQEVAVEAIPEGWMALDIGSKTAEAYAREIQTAGTVLWFGPIGVFEMEAFSRGTRAIGGAIAASGAVSIVGGGDSAAAVEALQLEEKMTLVSTGGGASLEMIEGKILPALQPLA